MFKVLVKPIYFETVFNNIKTVLLGSESKHAFLKRMITFVMGAV